MEPAAVAAAARAAGAGGASRFCMGAAWREVKEGAPIRIRPGLGARGVGPGLGSVLHPGDGDGGAGGAAEARRMHRV